MGRGFFDLDGPFYRVGTLVFDIAALSLVWLLFCLPVVTAGASTTALFYVASKKVRKEEGYLLKGFWKSFKMNFLQSTIIWILILIVLAVAQFNLYNLRVFGELGKYIAIFQYAMLLQVLIISIYIFPLISRLYLKTFDAFKLAFIMANKHLLTTIVCVSFLVTVVFIIAILPIFIVVGVSLYALGASYFIEKVLIKYLPKEEEIEEIKEPEAYEE